MDSDCDLSENTILSCYDVGDLVLSFKGVYKAARNHMN
jgi:hypothetical protein